jgi:hypothetical protein
MDKFIERVAEVFEEERTQPLQWFYLSFAGEEGFRGAAIVEARGIAGAVSRCNVLQINPHGEVMGIPIGDAAAVPPGARDRLLLREELQSIFSDMKTLGELERE